ncbi:tryptophan 2,3-dioxygenase [Candidatus Aquiluna sp. UB-MaderosW2red]|jgi:tryptophan 2,3-dioxygenase|uniref:tryptophan 2,3-dioxygenase n=1 Tax=Candidatus Aquiluna sp. UB-MaderosW2red TaxID=1855377 RepID=UPI000875DD2A|nr:tryptophan 2,3-dioxygenase family protein [Candidatus Aquiluna sp. UB-MaderosW2red]SCX07390.1 tryptophan 2,3-dioxygenase [Candidatus Aquiluna sp. UB-MaderosW2red]
MSENKHVTYISYLKVDELLELQHPLSDGPEHDELLFITIHQVYELWFKQILHEASALQVVLEKGDSHRSLAILGRIRTIMKTCVSQLDILETMTPLQFNSFRERLSSASGFQSAQFRELEAVLGRRDQAGAGADKTSGMGMAEHLVQGSSARARVEAAMTRPSLWDSAMHYFNHRIKLPSEALERDVAMAWEPHEGLQIALIEMHRTDPEAAMVSEALVDFDEGLQEWRYRHVKMVERTIGRKMGSGGSAGAGYLASTLFNPVFPDLWAIRSKF